MFQTNSPDSKAVFINFFSDLRSSAAARCTSSDSCPESELGDAHFSLRQTGGQTGDFFTEAVLLLWFFVPCWSMLCPVPVKVNIMGPVGPSRGPWKKSQKSLAPWAPIEAGSPHSLQWGQAVKGLLVLILQPSFSQSTGFQPVSPTLKLQRPNLGIVTQR